MNLTHIASASSAFVLLLALPSCGGSDEAGPENIIEATPVGPAAESPAVPEGGGNSSAESPQPVAEPQSGPPPPPAPPSDAA